MRLKLCYLVAGWPGIAVPSGSAQLPTHTRRSSSSPSYHWRTISINTFKRSALFLQQTQYPEIPGGLSRGHYLALWCQITFSKGLHVNRYIQRCGKAPSLLHLLNENCSLHYMFLFIVWLIWAALSFMEWCEMAYHNVKSSCWSWWMNLSEHKILWNTFKSSARIGRKYSQVSDLVWRYGAKRENKKGFRRHDYGTLVCWIMEMFEFQLF